MIITAQTYLPDGAPRYSAGCV